LTPLERKRRVLQFFQGFARVDPNPGVAIVPAHLAESWNGLLGHVAELEHCQDGFATYPGVRIVQRLQYGGKRRGVGRAGVAELEHCCLALLRIGFAESVDPVTHRFTSSQGRRSLAATNYHAGEG
jgi:hypothetical protein